jgi:uncharacterized protein (DUF2147 family)
MQSNVAGGEGGKRARAGGAPFFPVELSLRVFPLLALLLLSDPTFVAPAAADADEVAGTWMTEHHDAKIRLAPCGPALCGTIVWLAEPNDSAGQPAADVNNPDAAKRTRPLIGLTILTGLTKSGEEWRGRIYNSDDGKDYDVRITLLDALHAAIKGCVLAGLFCGGETWTRQ